MADKKEVLENLQALDNLKNMAENYEEIAATRMQRIRDSVLQTRDYLIELSEVFVDLKSSYNTEIKNLLERRKKDDKTLAPILQKNGKLLMVYMSSNGRLYGSVTKKTYDLFIKDLKANKNSGKTDLLLIGSAGKDMFEHSSHKAPFEYIDIPDDNIGIEDVKKLMKKFLLYDRIHIYHGKFGNVVKQSAVSSNISGDDVFEKEAPSVVSAEERFIYEPAFEKVFHFFETQIMSALFKQTFNENQLARQASRVNAMEEALIHIEDETKRLNKEKTRMKHLMQNKQQQERLSGIILWDID